MNKGIIGVISAITGAVVSGSIVEKVEYDRSRKKDALIIKNEKIIKIFDQWLRNEQEGKSVKNFFHEKGYLSVAIYGGGHLGQRLLREVSLSETKVAYVIDKNAYNMKLDVPVFLPDDNLAAVDAVVVTTVTDVLSITQKLSDKLKCPVIELEDIIDSL